MHQQSNHRSGASMPRGPHEAQRESRMEFIAQGLSLFMMSAGGAVTIALVSNPVGWGFGLFYLIAGACAVPLPIVSAVTAPMPKMTNPEKAKDDLIEWLRKRKFIS